MFPHQLQDVCASKGHPVHRSGKQAPSDSWMGHSMVECLFKRLNILSVCRGACGGQGLGKGWLPDAARVPRDWPPTTLNFVWWP